MTVHVYDPIPGHYDHRSGDCPMHGTNVPHARIRGSIGPYSCVECLLTAARRLADSPTVVTPAPVLEPEPPPPPRMAVPPPPPPPLAVGSMPVGSATSNRFRDAARFLRVLTDPESPLNRGMRGVAKLCEVAAGPSNERETCHRVTSELTHLDDSEPEFWQAHEYVMRERAQARAQGYSIGRAEGVNGRGAELRAKYEALLSAARDLDSLLTSGQWTNETWRAAVHKLRSLL